MFIICFMCAVFQHGTFFYFTHSRNLSLRLNTLKNSFLLCILPNPHTITPLKARMRAQNFHEWKDQWYLSDVTLHQKYLIKFYSCIQSSKMAGEHAFPSGASYQTCSLSQSALMVIITQYQISKQTLLLNPFLRKEKINQKK